MDAMQYQGLMYLSLGAGVFTSLLLGLRSLGEANNSKLPDKSKDDFSVFKGKEPLTIVGIINESPDIKTFRLRRGGGKKFPAFRPGQFLSIQIGDHEKTLRSYSVSSANCNLDVLSISVKKISDGVGSGWFHERKIGDQVWAYAPNGHFSDHDIGDAPRIYVAGGVGITPILSMIVSNLESAHHFPMTLFYGARTAKDLAFHSLLVILSQRHPNFSYFPVVSDKDGTWSGESGFVSSALIKSKMSIPTNAHYFFCGPPVMTDKIVDDLLAQNFPAEQIHTEKFASPASFNPESIPVRQSEIHFSGKVYQYNGRQTILEFLEAQGVSDISFACRVGVCGTCKCNVEGEVNAVTDAGLTPVEKRKNMFLPCVAFPVGKTVKLTAY